MRRCELIPGQFLRDENSQGEDPLPTVRVEELARLVINYNTASVLPLLPNLKVVGDNDNPGCCAHLFHLFPPFCELVVASEEDVLSSIVYSYRHGFSGFAAMLTESQAKRIADLPEVITIIPDQKLRAHTTRSWDFLGLSYYSQTKGLLHKANYGEDIIIGVVDSGIWPESRSFDDTGYGPIPSRWRGKCQVGEAFNRTHCNRKIIGARWYSSGASKEALKVDYKSPRGLNNHGTHTASTAAGNLVPNVSFHGISAGMARGGAPKARLAIYKALWGDEGNGNLAEGN